GATRDSYSLLVEPVEEVRSGARTRNLCLSRAASVGTEKEKEARMRSLFASLLGASLLAGCAVAPYDYGYGGSYYYDSPAYYGYYDYGPTYYYGPGYYGGIAVGPPAVVGSFQYPSGGRHWNGGSW